MKITWRFAQRIKEGIARHAAGATTTTCLLSSEDLRKRPRWKRSADSALSVLAANRYRAALLLVCVLLVTASPIYAQTDPWTTAINKIVAAFQGPIAKGMSIIGVVAGAFGLIFDTGHHAKTLSGIVLGVSMALGATAFLSAFFS